MNARARPLQGAVLYYRVSTENQDDQSQLRELRVYAKTEVASGFRTRV